MEPEIFQKGILCVRRVMMSSDEKRDMLKRLDAHVLVNAEKEMRTKRWLPPFLHHVVLSRAVVAITIVAFVGGGTVFASEGAVPGDVLYPIKVYVSEPMRAVFLKTPEARATWAAERVARRINEANELASQNRFDMAAREMLEVHVQRALDDFHSSSEEVYSDSLSLEDDLQRTLITTVQTEVEALRAHEDGLETEQQIQVKKFDDMVRSNSEITINELGGSPSFQEEKTERVVPVEEIRENETDSRQQNERGEDEDDLRSQSILENDRDGQRTDDDEWDD